MPAGADRRRRHQLNQIGNERQALGVVAGCARIARLSEVGQIADRCDRTPAVVIALDRPRRAGGFMDAGIQTEVEFHIPFEIIHDRAHAADAFHEQGMIADAIGHGVPVSGRRLGVRPVGPELGQHAGKVAPLHDVGRIRLARGGVEGVPRAVIGAEGVVSKSAGRNVHRHAVIRRQLAAGPNHGHHVLDKRGVTRATEEGRRSGINPGLGRIGPRQRKRTDAQPLCAQIVLDRRRGEAILILRIENNLQPLPAIHIDQAGIKLVVRDARQLGDQRPVDVNVTTLIGRIVRVGNGVDRRRGRVVGRAIRLPRTIEHEPGGDGIEDRVAHTSGSGRVPRVVTRVVTQRHHECVVRRERIRRGSRIHVALLQNPESRKANRLAPGGSNVRRGVFAAIHVTDSRGVVRCPRVVHRH